MLVIICYLLSYISFVSFRKDCMCVCVSQAENSRIRVQKYFNKFLKLNFYFWCCIYFIFIFDIRLQQDFLNSK